MPGLSKILFGVASSTVRRAARSEFNRSAIGQFARGMEQVQRSGGAAGQISRLQKMLSTGQFSREMKRSQLGALANEVQKFQGGLGGNFLDQFLDVLGPFGQLFKLFTEPQPAGLEFELNVAKKFLEAYGFEVRRPTTVAGAPTRQNVGAAAELLESVGVEAPVRPGIPEPPAFAPEQRTSAQLNLAPAPRRVQMKVVRSSNVYSVGFDEVEGQMYVTYLGGTSKNRTGVGPTYRYDLGAGKPGEIQVADPIEAQLSGRREPSVGADIFTKIVAAGSVGGAIWDQLRVRGTAFGHQFPYELVQLGGANIVPRQATPVGFRPRTVRQDGIIQASQLQGTGLFRGLRAHQTARTSQRPRPGQDIGVLRGSL